jgi:hypothetical protein
MSVSVSPLMSMPVETSSASAVLVAIVTLACLITGVCWTCLMSNRVTRKLRLYTYEVKRSFSKEKGAYVSSLLSKLRTLDASFEQRDKLVGTILRTLSSTLRKTGSLMESISARSDPDGLFAISDGLTERRKELTVVSPRARELMRTFDVVFGLGAHGA